MSRHTSRTSLIHHLNRRKSPSVQCYRRSVFSRRSKRCRYIFTGVPVGSSVSSTRGLLIISLISSVVLLFGILHASYVEDVDLISDQGISFCAGTDSSCCNPLLFDRGGQRGGICWCDEDGAEDQGQLSAVHVSALDCAMMIAMTKRLFIFSVHQHSMHQHGIGFGIFWVF